MWCGVDERGEVGWVGKEVKRDMLCMEREVLDGELGRVSGDTWLSDHLGMDSSDLTSAFDLFVPLLFVVPIQ